MTSQQALPPANSEQHSQLERALPQLGALLLALAFLAGCAHGSYVWVDDFPASPTRPAAQDKGYVLSPGDIISVRVFNQEAMSATERIRSDGKVSLPFLNDVQAAGYTPQVLASQLQSRLKDFINAPVVTVSVEEQRGLSIPVAGEVARPGIFALEPGSGVLQALVMAGGLTEYGGRNRIFVLRPTGLGKAPSRVRFSYASLLRGEGRSQAFALQPGDTVVVE